MLYFPSTRQANSVELPIAASAAVTAEGCALVADNTAGVFGVKPSTGSAGEQFLGVSVSQQLPLLNYPKVEEKVQGASNVITLARTPSAGTIIVFNVTTGAPLVVTTDYTISGKAVTLQAGTLGNTIRVIYKFVPDATEARAIQGDIYPGGATGTALSQVGVLRSGPVFTTEFDGSVNWSAASPVIKLGANGLFTIGGSGTTVDAAVLQAPTTTNPFLGLLLKQA